MVGTDRAMSNTDRAMSNTDAHRLDRLASLDVPVLVLYGEYDIFGDATYIVRDRFPRARQVTLSGSGYLHWLQQPDAYCDVLRAFYSAALRSHGAAVRNRYSTWPSRARSMALVLTRIVIAIDTEDWPPLGRVVTAIR